MKLEEFKPYSECNYTSLDVGALTPSLWGFEERETLMTFYEELLDQDYMQIILEQVVFIKTYLQN